MNYIDNDNYNNDNYSRVRLFLCGIIAAVLFLIVIFLMCTDFHPPKLFSFRSCQGESSGEPDYDSDFSGLYNQDVIVADLSKDDIEKLLIPLPGGVRISNVHIENNPMKKTFSVRFPRGGKNYDFSSVVNHSSAVHEIEYVIKDNLVTINVKLKILADYEFCIDNSMLYVKFVSPRDKYPVIVVIDAGHGGNDVGAVENGIYEKDIDLAICNRLKYYLDSEIFKTYYTRTGDSYPTVEERVDFVNELKPDLFISVHSNWFENSTVSGTSVLYNKRDTNPFGSRWLAGILAKSVSDSAGTGNRGAVIGNEIHIVRTSKVPVALIETGFMSNPSDLGVLSTESGQDRIAEGIHKGIVQALSEMGKYSR